MDLPEKGKIVGKGKKYFVHFTLSENFLISVEAPVMFCRSFSSPGADRIRLASIPGSQTRYFHSILCILCILTSI